MKVLDKNINNNVGLPIFNWCADMEDGAFEQAVHLSNLPFAFHHIAIMPDSHQGFGMPIGGVLATKDIIVPNAVGVDIGCGMCAVKTSLTELNTETLKNILGSVRRAIPVGFEHHKETQDQYYMPQGTPKPDWVVAREYTAALRQLGTLGGGNHFIEIQKGSDGFIWIMVHSGSRNFGKQVADHYNKLAIALNEKWFSSVPKKWELAYLPLDSEEGVSYLWEMSYCVDFAFSNRKLMMDRIKDIFIKNTSNIEFDDMINIAHNYAAMEDHYGESVIVHRKGATLADKDTIGIIPGSQGTNSYIVKGKGNPKSFNSCSHGAGRKLGRKEAIRRLDLELEKKKLDDLGILHAIRGKNDLEEAAGAYKDISEVMANQADLVDILVELKPLAVIKG